MLANALIGLREGLEAGLVVGILIAYLRKLGRADLLPRLWIGISLAIAASLAVGAILTWGPYGLSFQAQELLGGGLSILAVALVTWMIFWMLRHARGLRGELEHQLDETLARSATGSGWGLVLLGVVAVGREGIETALFVWASVKSTGEPVLGTIGAVAGILAAVVISYLIYRGFVRINLAVFFRWTGVFLILVAAGVLAYGVGDLQEAGLIPGWGQPAFSLAAVIPPTSWYATLLAGIFNFTPEPTWAQLIAWLAYIVVTSIVFLRLSRRAPLPRGATPTAAAAEPTA
ncbi:iron uptake transporter permease EfeU [Protaetiibacter intestinalis]|uniref:High-affinity Fe2+/Pb2+ permease n=1 Tax=Protaetiibacter intestinalis TaxID=2419774 RepID=A0A387BBH3_9MICO|nr:iron uptake transporter permease EfeU [Protaetiibacter intestinalis]AYF98496.1 high-affinity Fe2+/Pb2+ permease [Protaetiibacter intestinalis]